MIRRILALSIMLAVSAVPAVPAMAQRTSATLAAGLTNIRYSGAAGVSALTISPALESTGSRAAGGVLGSWSSFASERWTAQGTLYGSLYTNRSAGGLMGEVGGIAGGSEHSDGARTGQWLVSARLFRLGARASGWVGAGTGSMFDGATWRQVRQGEVGAALAGDAATWTAVITPTDAAGIRYTDARVALLLRRGPMEYTGSVGGRAGTALPALDDEGRVWGSVGVTTWIVPRTAIVAAAGMYPSDFTQGFPSGRYATLALRIGGGPRRETAGRSSDAADNAEWQRSAKAGVTEFNQTALGDGRHRLRVRARGARSVQLSGDPTAWVPMEMQRAADGWWEIDLLLLPGAHEIVVRRDGGAWLVPTGLPVSGDEFGGRSGRLVVR